ncbi:Bug family tripartite tricarboxylate transporter substrate binding protein [Pigmentiphaga kullae]|uniref:Tripartite-type tricarboxylate transporter receptor subunit TctC n=1 Tax=Pigmentiphaga kullae TaxID=151784 RepID=A0A4Q7NK64_9BURK|nr:tripartite tricarboxylate transporter substrate binding protein [Pigmentiphaga kullae]RZS85298.1 tripartite-type tricarboxylate transporter receptor subunit TctC [Pigmentiphaga kullae]
MNTMRHILACATGASLLAGAAQAQSPGQAAEILVPFTAGGVVDIMARGFAVALGKQLRQQVVVVNRAGAGGVVAMASLASAPADGHTLAYSVVTPLTVQPHRMKSMPFSPADIVPVCQTFENSFFIAAGPKSPYKDFESLRATARAQPGMITYGHPGAASSPHLSALELWRAAGLELSDVPYQGEAQMAPQLLSGQVALGAVTTAMVVTQKLQPLLVFASRRLPEFPNVPTSAELGYPIEPSGYGGLFVRKGTPADVIDRLESACGKAVHDPDYQDLAKKQFQMSEYLDRRAFTGRIAADYRIKGQLIPALNLTQ